MPPVEAVIFDMDGVLIDSEDLWRQVREEFATDLGAVWTAADQLSTMGCNTAMWSHIMAERLQTRERAGLDDAAVAREITRRMQDKYDRQFPEREGAVAAVHLAATHYKVGLATGSPTALAEHVLRITRLDRVFQATMYGDDVLHGKPAPDIYFAVLDKLGVAPARAVGVEDSGNGIRSLRAAGMAVVAAPGPNFPLSAEVQALAHVQIAHMGEFNLALVERAAAAARAETGGLAVAGRMVE